MSILLRFLTPKAFAAGAIFIALGYAVYIATDRIILQQEIKNFKATEAQNNERNETNETINNANPSRLCELNGGVFRNGQCI